ncbi:WXG100 family type VII secretion target [Paractinoplanes brasiliensis]|uniref:ESAT-6-like protein n=1 Tax=Paractinoplanes brasiliensis TaxID=52695 RepID=A0A4R6JLB6_9ACTN|nr:WXG100 family type VII secretion target [Actinoplanes brasiliensis]TDO37090.1 WXG100 family type VII secretion target [Actinoplanes brasiliensis]GID32216.1 hypothetical protein Abr02nite_71990 [Actinoplanes brasiliensis]
MATQNLATATEGMQRAADEFESTNGGFRAINSTVNSAIAELGVSWTGEAAMKFQNAMAQWEQLFTGVMRELDVMRDSMLASKRDYTEGGDSALDAVSSFGSAVPQGIPGI